MDYARECKFLSAADVQQKGYVQWAIRIVSNQTGASMIQPTEKKA
jgi:hypothetical protein